MSDITSKVVQALSALEERRHAKPMKEVTLVPLKEVRRTLIVDIETAPALAHVWSQRTSFVPHKNILVPGGIMGFGYKWLDEEGDEAARWEDWRDGYDRMLRSLHMLLDQADVVVGQNSIRFDEAKINGYFLRAGLPPYSPFKSIDLLTTTKGMGFESASLEYVARMLDTPHRKIADTTGGANNWLAAVQGDDEAWENLALYCRYDVLTTEDIYKAILPWLRGAASAGVGDELACPRCASKDYVGAGTYQAVTRVYPQYRCNNCGGYFRGSSSVASSKGVAVR